MIWKSYALFCPCVGAETHQVESAKSFLCSCIHITFPAQPLLLEQRVITGMHCKCLPLSQQTEKHSHLAERQLQRRYPKESGLPGNAHLSCCWPGRFLKRVRRTWYNLMPSNFLSKSYRTICSAHSTPV